MKYTYTAAWAVVGGISLRKESPPIVLASSENGRFLLTHSPDELLASVDEASAVGRLMLKGLARHVGYGDFQSALSSEIDEIRIERKKKAAGQAVLLFQAQGEIEASIQEPFREHDTFIVTFDAIEQSRVRQLYKPEIDAMKVAVAVESDVPSRFSYLTDGTHLHNESGKSVYSISFSMNAEGLASIYLSDEAATRIGSRYAVINQESELDSVERLFCQMADYNTDKLKAFLMGWTALEILIAKSFKSYEDQFLAPFANADHPGLRERFLVRIKGVMKDKYRLTDKFIVVTAVLFPNVDGVEVDRNYSDFCKLKGLRDSISHGEPFSEKDLPVHEMAALLRKYVVARIATPSNSLN